MTTNIALLIAKRAKLRAELAKLQERIDDEREKEYWDEVYRRNREAIPLAASHQHAGKK